MYWGCTECLFLCVAVSSCSKWMLLFLRGTGGSGCGWVRWAYCGGLSLQSTGCGAGFSSCGSWAIQSEGSVVVAHRLRCSEACGIFLDQGLNPCPLQWFLYIAPGKIVPYSWVLGIFFFCWVNSLEFFIHIGWWRKKDSFNFSPFKLDV